MLRSLVHPRRALQAGDLHPAQPLRRRAVQRADPRRAEGGGAVPAADQLALVVPGRAHAEAAVAESDRDGARRRADED